jgi:hypothetical protein
MTSRQHVKDYDDSYVEEFDVVAFWHVDQGQLCGDVLCVILLLAAALVVEATYWSNEMMGA